MRREDLYGHYERELLYLRRAGEGFAKSYPKVARRLALGPEQAADPHVERLIEAVAFLTSRLQLDLDRQFPRLTDALLNILYPHLLEPIPSCGIARFEIDPEKGQLTDGYTIPRGTEVVALAADDVRCRFMTTSAITLWPVEVKRTAVHLPDGMPFSSTNVNSVIGIDLATTGLPFESLTLRKLRLFINAEPSVAAAMFEALTCNVVQVLFEDEEGRATPVVGGVVTAAGLEPEESLLPYPANGHPAYRLLQEYFAFPQKFFSLDVAIPQGVLQGERGRILLGLSRPLPARIQIRPDTLLQGCAPVVNLFRRNCEPMRFDRRRTTYLVVADALRDRITEVHRIERVVGIRDDGSRVVYAPLFSAEHARAGYNPEAFWHSRREASSREDQGGTETWLSLVDLNFDAAQPTIETLVVNALCTNRGLAEEVPSHARLTMESAAPVSSIYLLSKPTLPHYRGALGATAWKLVSQMSLNHLSLSSGSESLNALREILTLHTLDDPAQHAQIGALRGLAVKPAVHRVGNEGWRGFCRGLDVTLEIDERGFVGASPLVFGEVLSRFLGQYIGINTFAQLHFRSLQRGGTWRTWPRIAGAQYVL